MSYPSLISNVQKNLQLTKMEQVRSQSGAEVLKAVNLANEIIPQRQKAFVSLVLKYSVLIRSKKTAADNFMYIT